MTGTSDAIIEKGHSENRRPNLDSIIQYQLCRISIAEVGGIENMLK